MLVIGHDPRLQNSLAEAEKAFFCEYLEKCPARPTYGPDARKYDLAQAVWDYINDLAGRQAPLRDLYATNLCNEFLPSVRGGGTVLIPDDLAVAAAGVTRLIRLQNSNLTNQMNGHIVWIIKPAGSTIVRWMDGQMLSAITTPGSASALPVLFLTDWRWDD